MADPTVPEQIKLLDDLLEAAEMQYWRWVGGDQSMLAVRARLRDLIEVAGQAVAQLEHDDAQVRAMRHALDGASPEEITGGES